MKRLYDAFQEGANLYLYNIPLFTLRSYVLTPAQPNGSNNSIRIRMHLRMPDIYDRRWAFTLDATIKDTGPHF